ncbi:MAG: apolipoprotein N-acyltransferase [Candidatus Hydrogenedentota bacterium]
MKMFLKTYGMSLASGVLVALAFPSWGLWFLGWAGLALLFWRVAALRPRDAGAQFFAAGWIFHSLLLHWLTANIFWAGGWALVGYQLLCIGLALFWAVIGVAWAWARTRRGGLGGALGLALLWPAMELAMARLFSGFGWSALAYSQGPNLLLVQWAAIGGVALVGFLIALISGLVALGIRERHWRWYRLAAAVVLLAAVHGVGGFLYAGPGAPEGAIEVGIVQTGFAQEMKYYGGYEEHLVDRAARQTANLCGRSSPDLVVWPEATVMGSFDAPPFEAMLAAVAAENDTTLFTGAVRRADNRGYNAGALVQPGSGVGDYYDKVHLVPFGEYMPFEDSLPFLRQLVPVDAAAGEKQKVFDVAGRAFGPLICFEVLHAPLVENLRELGADFLVVVTNLAWFGQSGALAQEFELGRMRAIETRLPLVHAANTGISGVFDPYGNFRGMHDTYPPEATRMRPMARTFALPAPAARPLAGGPRYVPYALAVGAVVLLLIAAVWPEARADAVEA